MGQSAGHSPKLLYNSCRLFITGVCVRCAESPFSTAMHLHKITAASWDAWPGLHGIQPTIDRLRMGWVGHVARMSDDRPPRRFLTAWIRAKRPVDRPRLSTAHCISDTIHRATLVLPFFSWRWRSTRCSQSRGTTRPGALVKCHVCLP